MSKAYGYGRASTGKQELTEEIQKRAVADYYRTQLKPKGIEWGGWHYDAATSGDKPFGEREQGLRLWIMAQRGDFIVASKSDRVFRNTIDGLMTMEAFLAKGVRCVMMDMPFDTRDANSELLFSIQLSVSRWERRKIGERTSAAMKELSRRGVRLGGAAQSTPIGWMWSGSCLVPDGEERARVDQMASMRAAGMSLERIEMTVSYPPHNWKRRKGQSWSRRYISLALDARDQNWPQAHLYSRSRRGGVSPPTPAAAT